MPLEAPRERRIFGAAVRGMRVARGLTQERVAFDGDLHLKYIGRLERGELAPKLDTMGKVAKGLGMQLAEFFEAIAAAFRAAEASG